MNRQKSHAYFRHAPVETMAPSYPSNHLKNSYSQDRFRQSSDSFLKQSKHSELQRSTNRSGIQLVGDGKQSKKDKQIQKLSQQLRFYRQKMKELQQKEVQNYVLRKENQMFRLQLQKIKQQIKVYSVQQSMHSHQIQNSKMIELNSKYQTLSQHNLQNLKIISELKTQINYLNSQNTKLRNQIINQQAVIQKIKSIESLCKKLQIDMETENRQWEIQKQTFIEILHAEIEGAKHYK